MKRLSADDSAGSRVKVGHRQALTAQISPTPKEVGLFCFGAADSAVDDFQPNGPDGLCVNQFLQGARRQIEQ